MDELMFHDVEKIEIKEIDKASEGSTVWREIIITSHSREFCITVFPLKSNIENLKIL